MESQTLMWLVFGALITGVLYIDLGVLNRKAHEVSLKEAAGWSAAWVALALLFCGWVYLKMGQQRALEFLTGYVIEYSLSVDNMFVFILIFSYFGVPRLYQARVLHWGILGAVGMRLVLIFTGVALLNAFHWLIYVFGAVLVVTGAKMLAHKDGEMDPGANPLLKVFKRSIPFETEFSGEAFFVKRGALWHATPLFAALLVVEASDLVFAVDSIPAILAVSGDTFVIYTSNVFAILGLRSLFFLLSGIMGYFRFLKPGISLILCFIGAKMLLADLYKVPISASLAVVAGILILSVLASVAFRERAKEAA